ncbi:MAG: hypothetical protein IKV35_04415 [Clostridia bacterium]|nr:hypothetical protein [Clostridia bacterium]
MSTHISLPHDNIVVLGRANRREHAIAFDWTNSGVFFRFRGNRVTFHYDVPALNQRLFLQITVDGRWSRAYVCDGATDVTVDAAFDGDHTVHCVRITEVLDDVPLVMTGITVDGDDAALLPAPALPDRKMLFLGDSITCGFGLLTKGLGNGFTTAEEDGAHTYAALTAAHFQAQAHFVCISGRGIARNCENIVAPLIPTFFEWTGSSERTPWDHSTYQPDIIVINAGTNDTVGENAHVELEEFKTAVKAFILRLREVHPNAKIVWGYGMMVTELHEAIEAVINDFEDETIQYCKFQTVWAFDDERGACGHPNQRAHRRCAGVLIDKISDMMDWNI